MSEKPGAGTRDVMAAVAFAEAGEWATARLLATGEPPPAAPALVAAPRRGTARRLFAWLERHLVAVALAEAGEHAEALRALRPGAPAAPPPAAPLAANDALDALLAARGVRMLAGVAPAAALGGRR